MRSLVIILILGFISALVLPYVLDSESKDNGNTWAKKLWTIWFIFFNLECLRYVTNNCYDFKSFGGSWFVIFILCLNFACIFVCMQDSSKKPIRILGIVGLITFHLFWAVYAVVGSVRYWGGTENVDLLLFHSFVINICIFLSTMRIEDGWVKDLLDRWWVIYIIVSVLLLSIFHDAIYLPFKLIMLWAILTSP